MYEKRKLIDPRVPTLVRNFESHLFYVRRVWSDATEDARIISHAFVDNQYPTDYVPESYNNHLKWGDWV